MRTSTRIKISNRRTSVMEAKLSTSLMRFRRRAPSHAAPKSFAPPSAWRAAKETYALVTLNYRSVAKIGVLPLFIVGALQTLYAIYPTVLNLLISVFGNLAAAGMFTVGLQQMVTKSRQNQIFRFQFAGQRIRGFVAVMLALVPIILLALGILALGHVLAQLLTAPTMLGFGLLMVMLMGIALVAYTAVRFSVIMPAIALDEPIDLGSALRATRGKAWQLWRGLMITLSPVLVIAGLLAVAAHRLGATAWAASGIQGFTVITAVPLAVAYLTVSYFRFIRRTAKPKMKIIGEPSFAARVKFTLERYADFAAEFFALFIKQFAPKPQPAKDQSALRRTAATTATQRAQANLAREVAEKLANVDAGKLEQIAAMLNKESPAAKKSSAQKSPASPVGRRAANANAANENSKKGTGNLGTGK